MTLFQKIANHLALIYPGKLLSVLGPDQNLLTFRVPRTDKEDIATNKKKYDQVDLPRFVRFDSLAHSTLVGTWQDVEWVKAAFPEDYYNRKQGPATAIDSTLCGKWKVPWNMLTVLRDTVETD